MKLILYNLLFLSLINSNSFSQGTHPNYDFTGIKYFWNIVKTLESKREPRNSDWEKLFSTPGYKVLTKTEFTEDFFKENFRLVFNPDNKKELEKILKEGKVNPHILHYLKVKDHKRLIKEQEKSVRRGKEHRNALKRTLEYLPQRRVSKSPPVSFVIFENNGRGSDPIVVDLAASIEWDYESFLAHEYHHWYRNKQLTFRNNIEIEDLSLVKALSLIEAEGIADMVDKKDWYTKPSSSISNYAQSFLSDVKRTPSIISYIDQALTRIYNHPNEKTKIGKDVYSVLPQRGHTTGYYMARVILEEIGKRKLVRTVGNPFDFILLYNQSAKKSKGKYPKLSDESVKFLEILKQKYSY